MLDIYNFTSSKTVSRDEVVQAAMKWHFSNDTGSSFWLEQRKNFAFDPLTDIKTVADLRNFPDVTEKYKTAKIEDLIPRGLIKYRGEFNIYESGGTTGNPTRIVERESRRIGLDYVNNMLVQHGISLEQKGNWLHIGPAGPHIVGRSIGLLANHRKQQCFYIDFDPRWVKKLIQKGDIAQVKAYSKHIIDQAADVLLTQDVSVIFVTPPLLEILCQDQRIYSTLAEQLVAIIWAGTSIDPDSLALLKSEFFAEQKIIGLYGNTLMGIAPQRPATAGDLYPCVFQPFEPFTIVDVVDPNNNQNIVPYDSRGLVRINLLTPECFVPNRIERDEAIRVKSISSTQGDGLAEITPPAKSGKAIIEGLY
ncbi:MULTISPECIES: hypothetical protein [Dickeya]|uniref:EhpF n=1 Tax=Dickeya aquatica TaxID=1401087 RepID=A0A375A9I6_9GAMM|nr:MULTISPECIES: hypothetical protein [Dickeya]SLM62738.1 EhpF [Dickeya aquatica]